MVARLTGTFRAGVVLRSLVGRPKAIELVLIDDPVRPDSFGWKPPGQNHLVDSGPMDPEKIRRLWKRKQSW